MNLEWLYRDRLTGLVVFWIVISGSLVGGYQRFEGTC
jgi:hypothetical protein